MSTRRPFRTRSLQLESLEHRQCMTANPVAIDLNPGAASSSPGVAELNGQYYVAADNGTVGRELFRLNADNSLTLVADIAPGAASSNVDSLVSANGLLYFTVSAPAFGIDFKALYRSDGTAAGTFALLDQVRSFDTNMVPMGNQLYFAADRSFLGEELYKTNGSVVWDCDGQGYRSALRRPSIQRRFWILVVPQISDCV